MVGSTHCGWCLIHWCRHIRAATNAEAGCPCPLEAQVEETTLLEITIAFGTCETFSVETLRDVGKERKESRSKSSRSARPNRRVVLPYFSVRAHKVEIFTTFLPSIRTG
jgi:hypothetical protein